MWKNMSVHVDMSERFEVKKTDYSYVLSVGKDIDGVTLFLRDDTVKDLVWQLVKIMLEGEENADNF